MGQGALLVPKVLENINVDEKGRPRLKPGSKAAKVNTQVHQGAKLIGVEKSLTDAQLKRRKRLSASAAIATSTLSLGALGAKGAGSGLKTLASASKAPKALRKVPGINRVVNKPHLAKIGGKIDSAAVPVSLASGGIGGLSGYNYAAIQRQEAKRRNVAPVSKAYNPERNRYRRNEAQGNAAIGAGAVAAGGSAFYGHKTYKSNKDFKSNNSALKDLTGRHAEATSHTPAHESNMEAARNKWADAHAAREKMDLPESTYTPGQKAVSTKNTKRLGGEARSAYNMYSAHKTHVADLGHRVGQTKETVNTLRKVRKISGAKAGGLALGAGGLVGGGLALRRYTGSKKGRSYAPRYRPSPDRG